MSPRTVERLRYCTNTGSIPSKFYTPERQKQSKVFGYEHTNSLYSPGVPIISPQMRKSFPSFFPKKFIRFLCECIISLLEGNLQSIKRHHVAKLQSEVRLLSLKSTTCSHRRENLASEKGSQLIEVNSPPVINHLS